MCIRVGITSIGSGVGQSIINSCRLSKMSLYTIGLGANPMAFGAYDCDTYDTLPEIYSIEYIDALLYKCRKHKADILIPGLDDELYNISINSDRFKQIGVTPIVSSSEVIQLCRDKVKMSKVLNEIYDSFVKSYNKDDLIKAYKKNEITFPLIAKPRSGFASRGLLIIQSADDFHLINNEHVVQEIAMPYQRDINHKCYMNNLKRGIISQVSEVSVQFVVGHRGNIIGKCATYNKLKNGVPIEIIPFDDLNMWRGLENIIPYLIKLGLKGPINIQGRMTDNGPKFFEMNARFTGITGLRAMMGFNEVEALIKDFADLKLPVNELRLNKRRIGMRQVGDRVVDYGRNVELDKMIINTGYYHGADVGKTVMVTGATGFLGRYIVQKLLERSDIESIICVIRNKDKANSIYGKCDRVKMFTITDIEKGSYNLGNVDILIHAAFSLVSDGLKAIMDSLRFTNYMLNTASGHHIPAIINISSQSVYGLSYPPLWDEELIPIPETPYAVAKWTSELITSNICDKNKQICSTSVRLSRIIGPGMRSNELAYKFIQAAVKGDVITILGGTQTLDLLDVRDAAKGIVGLLDLKPTEWRPVYNIGSGCPMNIKQIAREANHVALSSGREGADIIVKPDNIKLNFGMDIKKINKDTGWEPEIELVQSFFDMMSQHIVY